MRRYYIGLKDEEYYVSSFIHLDSKGFLCLGWSSIEVIGYFEGRTTTKEIKMRLTKPAKGDVLRTMELINIELGKITYTHRYVIEVTI